MQQMTDISEFYKSATEIEQIQKERLEQVILIDDEKKFRVVGFEKTKSKSTNRDQFRVELIAEKDGKECKIIDYLPFAKTCAWKMLKFFECIGKVEMYDSKNIVHAEVINSMGYAHFVARDFQPDKGESYKINAVNEFLPRNAELTEEKNDVQSGMEDDKIPF